MRVTKTQSRTPPTRPYPLHKKIKILFLGGTFIMSPIVCKFNISCELRVLGHGNKRTFELCEQSVHFVKVISRALNGDFNVCHFWLTNKPF